jgi:hypothetical protein
VAGHPRKPYFAIRTCLPRTLYPRILQGFHQDTDTRNYLPRRRVDNLHDNRRRKLDIRRATGTRGECAGNRHVVKISYGHGSDLLRREIKPARKQPSATGTWPQSDARYLPSLNCAGGTNKGLAAPPPFRLLALQQANPEQGSRPYRYARDEGRWGQARRENYAARHQQPRIAGIGEPPLPCIGESPTPTRGLCLDPRASIAHEQLRSNVVQQS